MKFFPRNVLNEIKWRHNGLSQTLIYYTNRGSPNDIACVEGSNIKKIGSMLIIDSLPYETYIPWHRIRKIEYKGKVVFER